MSDPEKQAPRLKVGSVWRHHSISWDTLRVKASLDGADDGYVAAVGVKTGERHNVQVKNLYRLATDDDLFATGTYEDSAYGEFLRDLRDLRDVHERHRREPDGPQPPPIGGLGHITKHLQQLTGYIKGYKDAIAGKPAYFKPEETEPCDE